MVIYFYFKFLFLLKKKKKKNLRLFKYCQIISIFFFYKLYRILI